MCTSVKTLLSRRDSESNAPRIKTVNAKAQDEHHRQLSDGGFRASLFGLSDGLVTNISLMLGFAGANPGHSVVRLAGLAGLVAGAFSMGSGEYLSMRAQKEMFEYEIDVERRAIADYPAAEQKELRDLFVARGIEKDLADRLSTDLMRDPDLALRTHAREELGVDTAATGSPWKASSSSFLFFALGAFVPLVPWLLTNSGNEIWWSLLLGGVASLAVGGGVGWYTRRGVAKWAIRQLLVTAASAAVTFGIGHLVGVGTVA
ncbi:MAG: VIT1/CCC1 transporter family protein [Acidobacteriota bacterium]|nr:VIT1/CCC1 transporter family protein [Acidobacteriota bacterium]